ncbi:MAG: hypothetical protein M1334_04015 [Patescibacteria group bacterium]|nr:hypothetical protein [Patescibacteria group bacterium]
MPKKIYIICSVRNITEKEKDDVLNYVHSLEKDGCVVRCPFRDTNQQDEIGLRIVKEHEGDIIWADEVHVWWNKSSQGSLWDVAQTRMAMIFMPGKLFKIVNLHQANIDDTKSYNNVVIATHFGLDEKSTLNDLKNELKDNK